ncbi:MAG TPA: methylmalonyl Co-A mutase-associated GTPase MeaB, partial [Flavobacterium sp.]|nr:methylmalonyl Co-A mutase-associated GTPase MeaB [Flavobacterium sp.]
MTSKKAPSSALQEKAGISQPESISSQSAENIQQSRKIQPTAEELFQGILAGNSTALSRAITLVESTNPIHLAKA